ncbi:MAG: SusC/RagA family TonB-linked outer membrane protein [Prolixibacteraceae bacterium]
MKIAIKREQNPNLFEILSNVSNSCEEKIAIKREQNPNLFEILSNVSNSREAKIKVWDDYTRERIFPGVTKILLKMKLTLIVILFSFLGTIASETYSQTTRLSLELKNETVEHVLGTIEEKSDFYFLYSAEMIDVNRKVSVNILNSPVEKILDLLFEGTGITYTVKGRQVVLLPGKDLVVQQQPLSVSGRVTDSAGTALPGVTVAIENTTQGTITDAQGNYSLPNVPPDATLVFSFVGMKSQEIGVAGKRNINVAMEEETVGIEEVVAIGYGTQKKLSVTGSISSINTDEIKQSTTGNLTNILGGRLSGIISAETSGSPGSGSSILIRGMSTYNNNSPLSIVDGVPRSFSELDPNEIQSITILKDASAAAVYGSRAANGVILVTTKRGLQGRPKFSYNFSAGVQNPTQYPGLLNAFEYASIYNDALLNMGYDPNNAGQAGRFYNAQQLADFKSGKVGVNWYNATFRDNAPQQTHNLNVNGGTDAIRYFFSLGYFDQDGMYEDIGYKRYNLRSNVDANINKNLSFSVDLDGRIEDIKEPGISAYSLFHAVVRTRPTYNAYSENGLPSDVGGEHPVEDVKSKGYYTSQLSYLTGSLGLNHKLDFVTKGLSAKIRYSGTRYFSLDKRLSLPYTMYRFDADGNITGTKIEGNKTAFSESFSGEKSYVANISLNYGRTFNNLHNITGLALYEQSEGFGDSFWASRTNYISNGIAQLFAGGDEDKNNNGSGYETGRKSWLGRVTYDFNNESTPTTLISQRKENRVFSDPDKLFGKIAAKNDLIAK